MITDILVNHETLSQRQGGVWAYVSPSRLNKWLSCPLAFKFQYVDGHRLPTSLSQLVGKTVHAGLEAFYRHRQQGIRLDADQVAQRIPDLWDQAIAEDGVDFASSTEEKTLQKQSADLVLAYLHQMPPDEPRPLAVEQGFEVPLVDPETGEDFGIPLVGIVDLVLDSSQGPMIADFKTSARSSEPLEITHEIQLSSYAYLVRQTGQRREAGLEIRSLIKTKCPRVEFHRYAPRREAHFRRLFTVIRAYLDDLDAGRFLYRPGFGCGMCQYRDDLCRCWVG
jgi:hypothetical protein